MSGENKNDGFDIAGDKNSGVSNQAVNINSEQNSKIIKFNVIEEQVYLGFKIFCFAVAIALAVCFLVTGLCLSKKSLDSILEHRTTMVEVSNKPLEKVELTKVTKNHKPALKSDEKIKTSDKQVVESMGNKMLYSGSIITLVAFILGTGLTLLLTIVKFSFHNRQQNENNPNVALAGPASELFMALANYIKSKIK